MLFNIPPVNTSPPRCGVAEKNGIPMTLLRQAYSLRINTRENKATGNRGILPTCDLEGHELLNLVDAPNKRGRLYRRHEAWQNVIAWLLRQVGIGITGSALGTPPTCKGIFSMAAAQATGWHAMSESAAETFRREKGAISHSSVSVCKGVPHWALLKESRLQVIDCNYHHHHHHH